MMKDNKVKLLIVDDSRFFSDYLKRHLDKNPRIIIVGTASDAFEAKSKIEELSPDMLVINVDMPQPNGMTFLKQLMQLYPIPCIVITSSDINEDDVIQAGAAGFLRKPKSTQDMATFCNILGTKVVLTASSPLKAGIMREAAKLSAKSSENTEDISAASASSPLRSKSKVDPHMPTRDDTAGAAKRASEGYIVALGASTGGTDALECIIKSFPANMPPIVVVQHMPPVFTKMYAERLNKSCAVTVKEAEDGDRLKNGMCIIGAGGHHLELKKDSSGYYIKSTPGEKVSGHCPSVDVLFNSVAETAGKKAIGAIMTGMGADGAKGLLKMHDKGAYTIGQNKETCVVYGMPMEAYKLGACSEQQPLENIGAEICHRLAIGW